MAGDTTITVIGNLTANPELRFTPTGAAVANFTIASTPRYFDRITNTWKDAEAMFLRCAIWRDAAENASESLIRGARVIVSGRLKQRNWQTPDGDKRSTLELEVDEIGPSLRYATAQVHRTTGRNHQSVTDGSNGASRSQQLVDAGTATDASHDPWSSSEWGSSAGSSFGGVSSGEPVF